MSSIPYYLWLVEDTRSGNQRQLHAMRAMLAGDSRFKMIGEFTLDRPPLWHDRFMPAGLGSCLETSSLKHYKPIMGADKDAHHIILSAGGRTAALARALKAALCKDHHHKARVMLLQILSPHFKFSAFDLIIAPQHDRLVGNNIIPILGGLNDLNRAKLDAYLPENYGSHAARPKILLLIGGDNSQFRFDQDCMNALIGWIKQQAGNYDFMVSASRRTDSKARDALHKICDAQQHLFFDPVTMADQPNPYFKWLAMADHIIVSQDSVNMISEALMSERPIYCYLLTRKAKKINKFDQFIANLQRHNLLTLLTPQDLMTGDFNKVSAQKTIDISPLADQKHYILDRIFDKMTAL